MLNRSLIEQRDGHKTALHRRGELRDIASNARLTVRSEAEKRAARDEEEMRRLLEALAIRQTREEAELAKKFAEREKQLWAVSLPIRICVLV